MKPTRFEKWIIKFIPILLPILSAILCAIAYLLDEFAEISNKFILWLPFGVILVLISMTCGILIKKLYFGAHNDALTGLYNRRYFNYKLDDEISRIKRTQSVFSLILIDIDNFKKVNDTNGHLMGDEILKKLSCILKQSMRSIDIVARWGGEEFAIILPETDLNGARTFAERLRKTVEKYDFGLQVTISLGIVSTCDDLTLDELLTQADEALYTAKEKKNKVVAYSKFGYCET
ncbi:GGDEF domain-containing protein [Desulfitobacterium metallireducens]|uniref:GGDEF domain-containing protein n=1 Tax=Desulfitobacterium metallireducens TaxID=142877 RepID=UPI0012EBB6F4|nr:GGDEF domain-containing protein [Desulfitobacterium metallireducens]